MTMITKDDDGFPVFTCQVEVGTHFTELRTIETSPFTVGLDDMPPDEDHLEWWAEYGARYHDAYVDLVMMGEGEPCPDEYDFEVRVHALEEHRDRLKAAAAAA